MKLALLIIALVLLVGFLALLRAMYLAPLQKDDGTFIYNRRAQAQYIEDQQKASDAELGIERFYADDAKNLMAIWEISMRTHDVHEVMRIEYSKKHKREMCYMSLIKKQKDGRN